MRAACNWTPLSLASIPGHGADGCSTRNPCTAAACAPYSIAASRRGWRVVLAVSLLPILLSLAAEWLGSWPVSNAWRVASAVPAGWAAGALLAEFLSFQGRL